MATKAPKKTVKRMANAARPIRKNAPVALKQPAWKKWMVRPLSISQAAIITMGWEPMPGLKTFISDRPLKLKDLRSREHEIEEACRRGILPTTGNGLPRRVSLQDTLTFAQSKGWSLPKRAQEVLDRIRFRVSPAAENINDLKPPLHEEPPAQGLLKLPDAVRSPNSEIHGPARDSPQEPTNRLADSLLRIIGALSVEIEDLAKKCKNNRLLDGDALNVSGLSRSVSALISKERGSNTELPGFTERTIHSHLSSARKKFFGN